MFDDVPVLLAFTGGLIATVNPCGAAMLPAYLSFFLGVEDRPAGDGGGPGVVTALRVGATVAAGFLAVFFTAWVLLSAGIRAVVDVVGWAALAVGFVLVVLGVRMLAGRPLPIRLPAPGRAPDRRSTGGILGFGTAYAVASLSCTLPVFLAVVAGTATRVGVAAGTATFAVYAAGMLLPLFALTLAVAAGRDSLVRRLRGSGGLVTRTGGVLLILAGAYVVAYWLTQLTGTVDGMVTAGVYAFEEAVARVANLIDRRPGATAVVALAVVAAAIVFPGLRRLGHTGTADPSEAASALEEDL